MIKVNENLTFQSRDFHVIKTFPLTELVLSKLFSQKKKKYSVNLI